MASPLAPSPSLSRILEEAEDIAESTGQPTNTAHILLAFFTTKNQAERLLRDRDIDEDAVLDHLDPSNKEIPGGVEDVLTRAVQVAAGCGAHEVDALHILVAMTRTRDCLAHQLLTATCEKLGHLRTRALTILTGAVPRWLERGRNHPGRMRQLGPSPHTERPHIMTWTPPLVKQAPPKTRARAAYERRAAAAEGRSALPSKRPRARVIESVLPEPVALPEDIPPTQPLPTKAKAKTPPSRRAPAVSEVPLVGEVLPESHVAPVRVDSTPPSSAPWVLAPEEYPWLTSLGRNLTVEAAENRVDRLIGREAEVNQLIDILGKRRANNPCLVGDPGVGKTAVVEGLARAIVTSSPKDKLRSRILISLDVGALLVGTHLRGSFSEKLAGLREEVKKSNGRVFVFFDELHTLVGAGSTGDGPQDAANELKSALARGDFPCVGATTHDEYAEHIEKDPALARRFVQVIVQEPEPDKAVEMLHQIVPIYAEHHRTSFRDEALRAAVDLSVRYLPDGALPDKAIALVDLAGSRAARQGHAEVTAHDIAELVSERTDLPVERLLASDRDRLLGLEKLLGAEVIGHRPELERIAEVVRRGAAGFRSRRPQGVFLFLGPTGVGKTETARALAKVLHGDSESLIRIDCTELSEAHAVARLVGAPPGYVGHDAGGQLTEAVRRRPGRVVLFDEMEKAHRDVLQLLLQVLDEGRLTDGKGRTVSFSETIVVLTSNLGSNVKKTQATIGFDAKRKSRISDKNTVLEAAKKALPPELWSRIEEKLVFSELSHEEARAICHLLVQDSSRRLHKERGISFELDDVALDYILDEGGFDSRLGARPMRQVLARLVEGAIASRILEGRLHADEHVFVTTRGDGSLVFLVDEDSLSQRPRL